jgi:hypothetical protein
MAETKETKETKVEQATITKAEVETKKEKTKPKSWADLSVTKEDKINDTLNLKKNSDSDEERAKSPPYVPTVPTSSPTSESKDAKNIEKEGKKQRNLDVMNKEPCIYFSRGFCRYGQACFYLHDTNGAGGTSDGSPSVAPPPMQMPPPMQPLIANNGQEICRYYNTRNGCNRKDNCAFAHVSNTKIIRRPDRWQRKGPQQQQQQQQFQQFQQQQGQPIKILHKCPNEDCPNMCFGKQCSQCHEAMFKGGPGGPAVKSE